MSIRTKISLIFIALAGSLLLGSFIFVYYFSYRYTENEFYERLSERVNVIEQFYLEKDELSSSTYSQIKEKYLHPLENEKESIVKVDIVNQVISGVDSSHLQKKVIDKVFKDGHSQHRERDQYFYSELVADNEGDYIVTVSAIDTYGRSKLNNLRNVLSLAFLIGLVGIFLLGRFYSGQVLKPISDITVKANKITASNLHLRLATGPQKDELDKLAFTFNGMLDRLETSFEIQNSFVSNASHELRNPLTVILGETEITLQKDRSPDEYRDSLQTIEKEAQRLELLVTSLLGLAQTTPESTGLMIEPIRIDELVIDVKREISITNPDNKILIDFSTLPDQFDKLVIQGNPSLLKVAVSNILDNANKFSQNKEVIVKIYFAGDRLELYIKDQGVGIPQTDLNNITEPFYRASNARRFKGFGIGLPLSYKILKLHGASMQVSSVLDQGTEVVLTFPLSMV